MTGGSQGTVLVTSCPELVVPTNQPLGPGTRPTCSTQPFPGRYIVALQRTARHHQRHLFLDHLTLHLTLDLPLDLNLPLLDPSLPLRLWHGIRLLQGIPILEDNLLNFSGVLVVLGGGVSVLVGQVLPHQPQDEV